MSEQRPPFDPGWNDPPTFNYSNAPPPTKTKLNLNKRIAFPIQASDNSAALPKMEISGAGLPMPFAKVKLNVNDSSATVPVINNVPLQPPPSSMTSLQKPCESVKESNYSSNLSEKLGNSLEPVMDTLREINGALASTDSSKVEEIDKRLKILETMWTDGKIDDKLKILLVNTAKALQDNQFSAAIALQRSIIVDHGSNVCAQWGPALRQLILLKESKIRPPGESIPDTSVAGEPTFINPLDDRNDDRLNAVGRVKHL